MSRTITTAAELDALPFPNAVTFPGYGDWHKRRDGRWLCDDGDVLTSGALALVANGELTLTGDTSAPAPAPSVAPEVAVEAGAVVRERLPVKPGREDIYRAWHGTDDPWAGCADSASIERVLDLFPGRSEAEVGAEVLREAADEVERIDPEWDSALWIADATSERGGAYHPVETWLRERADRLAAEGGAS